MFASYLVAALSHGFENVLTLSKMVSHAYNNFERFRFFVLYYKKEWKGGGVLMVVNSMFK